MRVLCVNTGSSSVKVALFDLDAAETRTHSVNVEGSGDAAVADALSRFADVPPPDAVGHRVVHGGPDHAAPARIDDALLASLRRLVPLAPLHLPIAITAIEAVGKRLPGVPQVACFDTAFHRRMPLVAQRFALTRELWDGGVRRYGFHGLSYEYVLHALEEHARGRVVIAHLGNGASLAAVRDGEPVDTTMGLTPTGGVMMGSRCGDLDPGVLVHLLTQRGWDAARVARLVDHESGLLGISETTSDMRLLLERRGGDPRAAEAVELFCWQLRKGIGALAASLGGLDTLVFTGGIGEHAAAVRAETCEGLGHLGIRLDQSANASGEAVVSAAGAACTVRVVHTDEDLMIARHTRALLDTSGRTGQGP